MSSRKRSGPNTSNVSSKKRQTHEDSAGPSAPQATIDISEDLPQEVVGDSDEDVPEEEGPRTDAELRPYVRRSPVPDGDSDAPVSVPKSPVNFTSEARSFGVILNGSAGNNAGQDRLVIDPVQRPYGWSSEKAQQMAENLLHSYRANITKASYGEATLHKQSDDDCKCFVLNGQQRLISITILLSVLRHLARKRYTDQLQLQKIDTIMLPATLFTFREAESMSAVTRIQVRDLQGDFFATYISPAVDSLGSFWDEEGKLLDGLAGHDTINRRFMQVADAFKQTLERARTPGGTLLLDNLLNIEAFSKQVLNRTHLAWSVHVGGGNSYKCLLYAQSNAQQMCTTEVDMLKAELLKNLDYEPSNAFSNIWDQYLLKLNDYQLASLGSKTMFEYIFHVIHLLVNLPRGRTQIGFQTDQLRRVFMDPNGVIDISGNPNQFMANLFRPVAQAMDRIFNWRRELQIEGSQQMQRLLDQVKTSCRLLLRIANGEHDRPSLSYWLGSCAVPLFIQLYPADDADVEQKISNLKLLAQHLQALERRVMWQWLCAPHAQKSWNILVSGGKVKTSKHSAQGRNIEVGVMRLLNPKGVVRTTWKHDPDVLTVLTLEPAEATGVLKSVVNIRYSRRNTIRPKLYQLLWIYDDELRNPTGQNKPLKRIEEHDYDHKLANAKCNAHLAHLVPQKLTGRAWTETWSNEDWHKQCRHLLGNLALLPDRVNESLGNSADMEQMMEAYNEGPVAFLSTSELTVEPWKIEDLLTRHKKIVTAIALRFNLPQARLARKLPQLCETARGDDKLSNTTKWQ